MSCGVVSPPFTLSFERFSCPLHGGSTRVVVRVAVGLQVTFLFSFFSIPLFFLPNFNYIL